MAIRPQYSGDYQWIEVCLRKLKPNGSFYFMCSTQCLPYFDLYLRKKLTVLSRIVWFYDASGVQAKNYFGSLYEPILFWVSNPEDYTFNADDIKVEARTGAQRKLIDYRKPVPSVYSSTKVPGNVWDAAVWPREFEILYVIDVAASRTASAIVIELFSRKRKKNGDWSVLKGLKVTPAQAGTLPDPQDAEAVAAMLGGQEYQPYQYYSTSSTVTRKALTADLALRLIPKIAAANRLRWRESSVSVDLRVAAWDPGEPWRLWLEVRQREGERWSIEGSLRRGEERMEISQPLLLLEGGLMLTPNHVARFDAAGAFPWIAQLRRLKQITFRDAERDTVLASLLECSVLPPLELDAPLRFEERRVQPRFGLRVKQRQNPAGEPYFHAHLLLDYGHGWMEDSATGSGVWLPGERVYVVRDTDMEKAARETLDNLGLKPGSQGRMPWRLPVKTMPRVVRELLHSGWHVEAEGKAFRQPGATRVAVSSGIDWFELHGEVDYGGATANLPQLLAALRRGDSMVPLDDGTFGLLPEEWLARFAPLAGLGTKEEGPSALPPQPGGSAGRAAGGAARRSTWTRRSNAPASACAHFHGVRGGRAAGGFRRPTARLPARRPGLDGVPARVRLRRLPGGRYGRGQNRAGAGRAGSRGGRRAKGRRWWWRRNR